MRSAFAEEFVVQSILRMEENTPRIERCLGELSEEEVWQRPNPSSNSIANLVLHLCGNITQYILSSLGQKEDTRNRDGEFSIQEGWSKAQLLGAMQDTVRQAVTVINNLDEESLMRIRSVQGFQMTGVGIIVHVVEHYSYHTGQIAFWTKHIRNKDLGFYANLDLNKKNEV